VTNLRIVRPTFHGAASIGGDGDAKRVPSNIDTDIKVVRRSFTIPHLFWLCAHQLGDATEQ
jgi:hypothetical protein